MSIGYLNGVFSPLEDMRVSVLDRGFLFGDGVYEVIPVYGGQLFRLEDHLARLAGSLSAIRVANPCAPTEWERVLTGLVERNGGADQAIYLQVTRGAAARDHAFPAGVAATVFAMSMPLRASSQAQPERAITRTDNRWARCDIKAITLLPNVLLRQEAIDGGARETIMLRDGFLTEGAASNVFVVRRGRIATPPKGPRLLPGITREVVLELASGADLPCMEAPIPEPQLRDADEVWITSSTMQVVPVVELDGRPVGRGRPGPMWETVQALFEDYKRRVHANAA